MNPVFWMEAYGWIVLVASLLAPHFESAFYFGVAYMATIYVLQLFLDGREDIRSERVLLVLTWLFVSGITLGLIVVTRQRLFLGYSMFGHYRGGIGGMDMSRSSGIARFCGVCSLLALCRFGGDESRRRWLWLVPAVFCAVIIWYMQSRGAMIGFVVALVFLLIMSRTSKIVYLLIAIIVGMIYAGGYEAVLINRVEVHVQRGQEQEELQSMSGRTRAYKKALRVIAEHPFLGQGNWADRHSIKENVHNTYLQALMNGGIIGFIPFIISWIVGWRLFFRLNKLRDLMETADKQLFTEASIIMVFFTVRSIPETTTASFSVATLIMVAVYLYLAALHARLTTQREETAE